MYWFLKAGQSIAANNLSRAGLVSTNSIRGGANRVTLRNALASGRIFDAWADEEWTVEGAAVRVSLVCFDAGGPQQPRSDGVEVEEVFSDLTARQTGGSTVDLTKAARLDQNRGVAFMGDTKGGAFDVSGDKAREWLQLPLNPNGRPNSDVLRPWVNGMDVTRRSAGKWIVDFGWIMSEAAAALYEAPFAHCLENVKPERGKNRRDSYRKFWWRHVEARQGMWNALVGKHRYLVTPRVAKHRFFVWTDYNTIPDSRLFALARDDDFSFGLLSSNIHTLWSLATCSWHGVGNDPVYNVRSCLETFPFPEGLTPDIPAAAYAADPRAQAIAKAAADLNAKREAWLNPPDLVRVEPEVVPGYPDRLLPVDDAAAAILKKRTLTNLYNQRPAWLDHAHAALDAAVADAYGWAADFRAGTLTEDEILARLFALNQSRAAQETR